MHVNKLGKKKKKKRGEAGACGKGGKRGCSPVGRRMLRADHPVGSALPATSSAWWWDAGCASMVLRCVCFCAEPPGKLPKKSLKSRTKTNITTQRLFWESNCAMVKCKNHSNPLPTSKNCEEEESWHHISLFSLHSIVPDNCFFNSIETQFLLLQSYCSSRSSSICQKHAFLVY